MNVLVERAALDDIAAALREVYGNDTQYRPSDMADAIRGAVAIESDIDTLEATIKPGYYLPRVGVAGYDRVIVEPGDDTLNPDDYRLLNRTFTVNGSYKAENFGYYGFDTVTVAVNTAVVGKDSDGDDAEAYVDNDDPGSGGGSGTSTGTIKTRKLPNRIVITQPPTKTNYIVAEPISTSGMVVKAYYPDGSLYGDVTNQCSIDPIVATEASGGGDIYSDGDGVVAKAISYSQCEIGGNSHGWWYPSGNYISAYSGVLGTGEYPYTLGGGSGDATLLLTKYNGELYVKRISGSNGYANVYGWVGDSQNLLYYRSGTTGDTPTESFGVWSFEQNITDVPTSTKNPLQAGTMSSTGGITVTWNRPGDSKALTDIFHISVSNPPSPINEGSGNESGNGNDHPITPHI